MLPSDTVAAVLELSAALEVVSVIGIVRLDVKGSSSELERSSDGELLGTDDVE